MKLKATTNLPEWFRQELNKIRPFFIHTVAVPHLCVGHDIGPAELFVQVCDEVDPKTHAPMVHVGLSGVSLNAERCANDFLRALDALFGLYSDKIKDYLFRFSPEGARPRVQLFVVIYLDGVHPATKSSLLEKVGCVEFG